MYDIDRYVGARVDIYRARMAHDRAKDEMGKKHRWVFDTRAKTATCRVTGEVRHPRWMTPNQAETRASARRMIR